MWKKSSVFCIAVLAFISCNPSLISASQAPSWVTRPPVEDGFYRYYIGRSHGTVTSTEEELVRRARANAEETAIRENYGIVTSIDTQSYGTSTNEELVERIHSSSTAVLLTAFRQKDFYKRTVGSTVEVFILFSYPKVEIQKEEQRQKSLEGKKEALAISQLTIGAQGNAGCIVLNTKPQGIAFSIDGISYGNAIQTPSKICMEQGTYTLRIESPYYENVVQKIIITKKSEQQVNLVLVPAKRVLDIQSNIPKAEVSMNGNYIGTTPLRTTIVTGESIPITVKHPESLPYTTVVQIGKASSPYTIIAQLIRMPSYIAVTSSPVGASVYINGVLKGVTPTGFFETESGILRVSLKGYHSYETTFTVAGGEKRMQPLYLLTPLHQKNPLGEGVELQQGIALYTHKDYQGALQAFERYVKTVPNVPYTLFLYRGKAYFALGAMEQAEAEYKKALERKDCTTICTQQSAVALAELYLAQEKETGYILSYLRKAQRTAGQSSNKEKAYIHTLFAKVYEKDNALYDAIKEYTKVLELYPAYTEGYFNKGILQIRSGNEVQREKGVATLQEALQRYEQEGNTEGYLKTKNALETYMIRNQ